MQQKWQRWCRIWSPRSWGFQLQPPWLVSFCMKVNPAKGNFNILCWAVALRLKRWQKSWVSNSIFWSLLWINLLDIEIMWLFLLKNHEILQNSQFKGHLKKLKFLKIPINLIHIRFIWFFNKNGHIISIFSRLIHNEDQKIEFKTFNFCHLFDLSATAQH